MNNSKIIKIGNKISIEIFLDKYKEIIKNINNSRSAIIDIEAFSWNDDSKKNVNDRNPFMIGIVFFEIKNFKINNVQYQQLIIEQFNDKNDYSVKLQILKNKLYSFIKEQNINTIIYFGGLLERKNFKFSSNNYFVYDIYDIYKQNSGVDILNNKKIKIKKLLEIITEFNFSNNISSDWVRLSANKVFRDKQELELKDKILNYSREELEINVKVIEILLLKYNCLI
ncbi:hypothetical protein [Spiroplasma culicicola]|uniref:Uncharacterized protein n=1 Tax=Spiroplasma culicicola AES-1 TaxID=1276246 RepID=W6A713_9MOLU|nr:hypothetical protein [Spiroplasma culicicola]AHI52777.1 hypothetical protein SCULI_v1c04360 [Spiroplasma culicicola AES-1]